jgi:2-amino-4-hydroxy-6-hydroxymethyldihydropteridine diphosphokinase
VFIALGSNIDPERNLQQALDRLKESCTMLAVSSVYQSPAFGFENQSDFLDIAVRLSTALDPASFKMQVLDRIEKQLGRDRSSQQSKFGPLPIDIDILLWGDQVLTYGEKPWHVPDKSILKYAAVALPLAEIAGDLIHPEAGITLRQIADGMDSAMIHQRTDLHIE